jgi:hypothetical protein
MQRHANASLLVRYASTGLDVRAIRHILLSPSCGAGLPGLYTNLFELQARQATKVP